MNDNSRLFRILDEVIGWNSAIIYWVICVGYGNKCSISSETASVNVERKIMLIHGINLVAKRKSLCCKSQTKKAKPGKAIRQLNPLLRKVQTICVNFSPIQKCTTKMQDPSSLTVTSSPPQHYRAKVRQEIYKSMAIPARAKAPMPTTSLAAAPVYLATSGPVVAGSTGLPVPTATELEAVGVTV